MNLEQVVKICKLLHCEATVHLDSQGEIEGTVDFFNAKIEDIREHFKELGFKRLDKKFWSDLNLPDIDLIAEGVRFNRVEECKIIGYKDVIVKAMPEHTRKVPIYDCAGVEESVK